MAAYTSPSKSPSRRVLGDLTPKAINTPSKQTNTISTQSPLKQVQPLSPRLPIDKENTMNSLYKPGKKRTIYEVDDAENIENRVRRGSVAYWPSGMNARDVVLEREPHLSNADDVADLGSPTEPNTPPEMEDDMPISQETSASKESFSCFVNYGGCSSQQSEAHDVQTRVQEPAVEEKRSRAELLKLRLGFGLYKVKTNQVRKSGAEILSVWESTSEESSLHASTSTVLTSGGESIPSITLSPARGDGSTHVVANLDPSNKFPKLVGVPKLEPTAYSSRMIHDYHVPSSPPTSVSPEQLMSPVRAESNMRNAATPVARRSMEERDDEALMSSAVKGNAAKGLLELMSGRR